MGLRNRSASCLTLILPALLCLLTSANLSSAQTPTSPPSAAPTTQAPEGTPPDNQASGFVFRKVVEEVILYAVVVDDQNRLLTDLTRSNFEVFEDGKLQELTFFRTEQVPVALGILIDNSSSMLPKRAQVNEAALQLVDSSQQGDQVFVVNFSEDAFLDQDYTHDVGKLRAALQRVETYGSTALYDAMIASTDHLSQTVSLQKKVLLVVTDGRDNASQASFSEVQRKLQSKTGPVVYIIALLQNERRDAESRQALRTLAEQTGGTAFFPSDLDEVKSIASSVARGIRSQYVIGYRSSSPQTPGLYHPIQVRALGASSQLRVVTRAGYYSGNTLPVQ